MFTPLNRHLLLEKLEEVVEEEESLVLVPDDYKVKTAAHAWYNVLHVADDCSQNLRETAVQVLVNESMVEEVSVNNEKYYLILENYIYGMRG